MNILTLFKILRSVGSADEYKSIRTCVAVHARTRLYAASRAAGEKTIPFERDGGHQPNAQCSQGKKFALSPPSSWLFECQIGGAFCHLLCHFAPMQRPKESASHCN